MEQLFGQLRVGVLSDRMHDDGHLALEVLGLEKACADEPFERGPSVRPR